MENQVTIEKHLNGSVIISVDAATKERLASTLMKEHYMEGYTQLEYLLDTINMNSWILPVGSFSMEEYERLVYIEHHNVGDTGVMQGAESHSESKYEFKGIFNAYKELEYAFIKGMLMLASLHKPSFGAI